ncbi:MAG: hypothetical protein Q4B50_04060, partial [Bacillota bacterium]|nr:hypothetical protein [Bacillota bacterium]
MLFGDRYKEVSSRFEEHARNLKNNFSLLSANAAMEALEAGYENFAFADKSIDDPMFILNEYAKKQNECMQAFEACESQNDLSAWGGQLIFNNLKNALRRDIEITRKMQEAAATPEGKKILEEENSSPISRLEALEKQTRSKQVEGKEYSQVFSGSGLDTLSAQLNASAKSAFRNSPEFQEMHKAMQACAPDQMKDLSPAEIHERLNNLSQKANEYLGKKSDRPSTQKGRERVELAQQILNASQEMEESYFAQSGVEGPERLNNLLNFKPKVTRKASVEKDAQQNWNKLIAEEKNLETKLLRTMLMGQPPRSLDSLKKDDQFCEDLSRMEYLRILKIGVQTPEGQKGHVSEKALQSSMKEENIAAGTRALKPKVNNFLQKAKSVNELELYAIANTSCLLQGEMQKQQQQQKLQQ